MLFVSAAPLPALAGFSFDSPQALRYKTFLTQEMLKAGYLATTSVYACISHTETVLEGYFNQLDGVFKQLRICEDGRNVAELLDGPVCHAGFKRLN